MAFILKSTNESIGTETTVVYSEEIIKQTYNGNEKEFKSVLASQLINEDVYADFCAERYGHYIKLYERVGFEV